MEDFLQKLDKKFDNNDQKINMIATFIGSSVRLAEFIAEKHGLKNLPPEILYLLTLTAANVIELTSDRKHQGIDMSSQTKEYYMGEQTQESIYRAMKYIVTEIYKNIQDVEESDE